MEFNGLATIIVGISINIVSVLIIRWFGIWMAKRSAGWKNRSDEKARMRAEMIASARINPHEFELLKFRCLQSQLWTIATTTFTGIATVFVGILTIVSKSQPHSLVHEISLHGITMSIFAATATFSGIVSLFFLRNFSDRTSMINEVLSGHCLFLDNPTPKAKSS